MIKLIHVKDTPQETFDFVVAKLREQGEPAFVVHDDRSGGACRYQLPDGRRCAAGHLMGDDAPMNNPNTLYALVHEGVVERPRFMDLVLTMQGAHDRPALGLLTGHAWARECAERMIALANRYDSGPSIDPKSAHEWLTSVSEAAA